MLAETKNGGTQDEERRYPHSNLFSHIVGYSTSDHGRAGIESWANFNLLRSNAFFLEKTVDKAMDEKSEGDNVVTTLDYSVQSAAYQALGAYNGAVVVLEPSTGKILAMVSKPDFDPNSVSEDWDRIVRDERSESALLNRASQGLYPPGSTFKIVTALEYVREHPEDYTDYAYRCSGSIREGSSQLRCFGGEVHGDTDLARSFVKSCNTSFANIGLSLDKERFQKTCKDLLFDAPLPVEKLEAKKSSFALGTGSSASEVMETSIGQGKTLVTPLHMAMITAAVANGGVLMKPYVIESVQNYEGGKVKEYGPAEYGQVMTGQEAGVLRGFMRETAKSGTASGLSGMSYEAYGKTGSAEFGANKGDSHAWFTGFAHKEGRGDLVVTVIMEEAGLGSAHAVPAAKAVFDAYYR